MSSVQLSATTTTLSGGLVCAHSDSNVAAMVRASSCAGTSTVSRNGTCARRRGPATCSGGGSGSLDQPHRDGPSGVSTRLRTVRISGGQRRRNPPVARQHPHRSGGVQRGQPKKPAGDRCAGRQDCRHRRHVLCCTQWKTPGHGPRWRAQRQPECDSQHHDGQCDQGSGEEPQSRHASPEWECLWWHAYTPANGGRRIPAPAPARAGPSGACSASALTSSTTSDLPCLGRRAPSHHCADVPDQARDRSSSSQHHPSGQDHRAGDLSGMPNGAAGAGRALPAAERPFARQSKGPLTCCFSWSG